MWLADKSDASLDSALTEEEDADLKPHSNSPPLEGGEALCEFYISHAEKVVETRSFPFHPDVKNVGVQERLPSSNWKSKVDTTFPDEQTQNRSFLSLFGREALSENTFTQTLLQSILSSVDSHDIVAANAWMETLLDVMDLLPKEVIRDKILIVAINKGQLSQPVSSRQLCCRMLGKLSTIFDPYIIKKEVLPVVLSLCQDVDYEVRACMCSQLHVVARGIGLEATKSSILPELVELSNDEESNVRLAGIESVVHMLPLLDDETCTHAIVPLVQKFCENSIRSEDSTLPAVAFQLGRLCHGLELNLTLDQKLWFLKFFRNLSVLGLPHHRNELAEPRLFSPMPDLVPELENKDRSRESRYACAYNFPAMVIFAGRDHFRDELHQTFSELCSDPFLIVRKTISSGFCEVVKFLNTRSPILLPELVRLLTDDSIEVIKGIVAYLPEILKFVCQFEKQHQAGVSVNELVKALITCEESTSVCSNWRLHAEFLTQLSCLPQCLSPDLIYAHFVPLLFMKLHTARPVPCRVAASYSLLVLLRNTYKLEHRNGIINELIRELCSGRSYHKRMLFIKVCELVMELFSKAFFKRHFFKPVLCLAGDTVPNIRLRLCAILPKLKSMMKLPKDGLLLQDLESCVRKLMTDEKDRDVSAAVSKAIEELDKIEVPTEPASRRASMDCEAYLHDLRKEEHERKLLEMELAPDNNCSSYSSLATATKSLTRQPKIPVRKFGTLPKSAKAKEFKSSTLTRASCGSTKWSKKYAEQRNVTSPKTRITAQHVAHEKNQDDSKTVWQTSKITSCKPTTPIFQKLPPKPVVKPKQPIDRCPSPMPPPRRFIDELSRSQAPSLKSQSLPQICAEVEAQSSLPRSKVGQSAADVNECVALMSKLHLFETNVPKRQPSSNHVSKIPTASLKS